MPSPTPSVRPVTPAPAEAPDAASGTHKRRLPPPDTADSAKRPRPSCDEGSADSLDEAAWHSRAWQIYAHGKRAARPAPAPYAWGYPVDD